MASGRHRRSLRAKVIDRFGQATVVENFKILYTWEERGETPFLKPYSYHAKEVVVEVMLPVPGDARRVNIVTRKIPLQDIHTFEFTTGRNRQQHPDTTKKQRADNRD